MEFTPDFKVVFTTSELPISRFIRWLDNAPVSHTFFQLKLPLGGTDWAAESTFSGTRIVPINRVFNNVVTVYTCKVDLSNAFASVIDEFGRTYDYEGAIKLGVWKTVKKWFSMLGMKLNHPLTPTKSLKCSELIGKVLKTAQLPGTDQWNLEWLMPVDILNYCKNHPELFTHGSSSL